MVIHSGYHDFPHHILILNSFSYFEFSFSKNIQNKIGNPLWLSWFYPPPTYFELVFSYFELGFSKIIYEDK